jgi:hypothetical protein
MFEHGTLAVADFLQRWPEPVNSSKAPADDPTLIDKIAN